MKKSIFLLLIVTCYCTANAQTQIGDADISKFPTISFTLNYYNPEVKTENAFVLKENEKEIEFSLTTKLPEPNSKNRTVLFLVEDMSHTWHKGQLEFSKKFVSEVFRRSNIHKGDKFNIAIFDRQEGNQKTPIHTWIKEEFSTDKNDINNRLIMHKSDYNNNSNQKSSELYLSTNDALDKLIKTEENTTKVLIVLSAGRNLDVGVGGKNDPYELQEKAKEHKITIYFVKYNLAGNDHVVGFDRVAQNTYGGMIKTKKVDEAFYAFDAFFENVVQQNQGVNYTFTFNTLNNKKDGKQRTVKIKHESKENTITYNIPQKTFAEWIKQNIIIILAIVLVAVGLIVLFIILFMKKRKEEKEEQEKERIKAEQLAEQNARIAKQEAEQNAQKLQQQAEQNAQELQRKAEMSDEKLKNYIYNKQEQENSEKRRKQKEESIAELTMLMNQQNKLPRLQCAVGSQNFIYDITKPNTKIGRNSNNDIVLNSIKVSGKHAEIMFNGTDFFINDLKSTNKVKINNTTVEMQQLKNADIIRLGDAVITFFV